MYLGEISQLSKNRHQKKADGLQWDYSQLLDWPQVQVSLNKPLTYKDSAYDLGTKLQVHNSASPFTRKFILNRLSYINKKSIIKKYINFLQKFVVLLLCFNTGQTLDKNFKTEEQEL